MQGRTQEYRSRPWRKATFTERKPVPMGVPMGPLRATLLRRMLSSTLSGRGLASPVRSM
ncbi:hypothetical protein D3C87_1939390 [compost metagenome]